MPYAEVAAAAAVIVWIELRVRQRLEEAADQLERDYQDNGGRRRRQRAEEGRPPIG